MRYTVTWLRSAEDNLTRIWLGAPDPEAVRQAADWIDHQLTTSSRVRGGDHQGVYELTRWPLHVTFEVSPDDRKVTVQRVVHLK
jgi:hypothetical protein